MPIIHPLSIAPLLPPKLAQALPPDLIDAVSRCGAPTVEELRLQAERFSSVRCHGQTYTVETLLSVQRMREILQALCGGSLYAYEETIRQGYLTPGGGIRVGVCGTAATENGRVIGVGAVTGLIVRIPHRVNVDASPITEKLFSPGACGGILIYAPPGVGKTTLLRAVAIDAASPAHKKHTVAVDTREELKYTLDGKHLYLNILSAYPRKLGIEIAVRSLGAELIVCDEIGNDEDVDAILSAANCGVPVVASAHAATLRELLARPAFERLHQARVFRYYVGIRRSRIGFDYLFSNALEADKPLPPRHN